MKQIRYAEGEPCGHPGCLRHVTHPCEGCGRIAGRGEGYLTAVHCDACSGLACGDECDGVSHATDGKR